MRFNSSSARLTVLTFIAIAMMGLFFQNCQPSSHVRIAPALSGQGPAAPEQAPEFRSPLEAATAPFAEQKVQFRWPQDGQARSQKPTPEDVIPSDLNLLVTLDNHCADETPGPLSRLVDRSARLDLDAQMYFWNAPQDLRLETLTQWAESDPCVIGLTQDDPVRATAAPNDPLLSQQGQLQALGFSDVYHFFTDPLRGSTATVVVAVIDSGTARSHPDLKNMLWTDSNGRNGMNFFNQADSVEDGYGHGTAVAGLIAAEANNGSGGAGVMGHNLKIMTLKVQDNNGTSTVGLMVDAIQYAAANGADVINISMEGNGHNATLQSALQNAVASGSFIAVAAGNGGGEITTTNYIIPAGYGSSIDGMMTVGSIDSYSAARSSFSNYGPSYVEIAAPGSNGIRFPDREGGYRTGQGTSYSCPLVAGAAALTVSFFKKNGIPYTPAVVETILRNSAPRRSHLASVFLQGQTLDLRSLAQYLRRTYLTPVDGGFDEN